MALPTRVTRNIEGYDPVREFDGLLSRFFNGHDLQDGGQRWAPYGVDIREDEDHFYVEADLPGFKKEEVDITLENQTLTISGEKKAETREANSNNDKGELLLNERRYTRFLRSFTLPPTVNEQSVDAKLNDGVLKITLNKREESKPRKIAVS